MQLIHSDDMNLIKLKTAETEADLLLARIGNLNKRRVSIIDKKLPPLRDAVRALDRFSASVSAAPGSSSETLRRLVGHLNAAFESAEDSIANWSDL